MRLTSKPLGIIVIAFIFGGISLSTWLGWWTTQSTKQPNKIQQGEYQGSYDPADIRGSYTFGEISSLFEIPLDELQQAFLPDATDLETTRINVLESIYAESAAAGQEIGTGSVRLFVAFYRGLPFETSEEYLLASAVDILSIKARLDPQQIAYLQAHQVELDNKPGANDSLVSTEVVAVPADAVEHESDADTTIKGKTTFRDLLDWGLMQEEIEGVIDASMPNPLVVIKDYCLEQGLEFGDIKLQLGELLELVK